MTSLLSELKTLFLAILILAGLSLVALAFVPAAPTSGFPPPWKLASWGLLGLLVAGVWIYWDHKRRALTPDEEVDKLLLHVAKRYRQTRSLEAIEDEYRTQGASDDTLMMIRSAPMSVRGQSPPPIRGLKSPTL